MENYDLFGDDLGSSVLQDLADLGSSDGAFSQQQPQSNQQQRLGGGLENVMQGFNSQQQQQPGQPPSYTQIGHHGQSQQGMVPPSSLKQQQQMSSGGIPRGYSDYGQYGHNQYAGGGVPAGYPGAPRPMMPSGYPPSTYPGMGHQSSVAGSGMHYPTGDYSQVMRPSPQSGPTSITPTRMATPGLLPQHSQQQQQQQYGYGAAAIPSRAPTSQESMYSQQMQRWNEQQSQQQAAAAYSHHYPQQQQQQAAPSMYRQPNPYAMNLPRPPSIQQQPQQPTQVPPPSQQQQQSNIPYMSSSSSSSSASSSARSHKGAQPPQQPPPSSMYPGSMYPTSSAQQQQQQHSSPYGDYTRMSSSGPIPPPQHQQTPAGSYPTPGGIPPQHQQQSNHGQPSHQVQQHYPGSQQQMGGYNSGYGQYYNSGPAPGGGGGVSSNPYNIPTSSMNYPSSMAPQAPVIPNGNSSYRPPVLGPGPISSPRPPAPSPRPQAPSTPTIPSSPAQQNQGPSSLHALEQMVMPGMGNKNSPSPMPPSVGGGGSIGVSSPHSGGPKTPLSPKTPMSPPSHMSWQQPPSIPPPPSSSRIKTPQTPLPPPHFLHSQTTPPQQQQQLNSNSPGNYPSPQHSSSSRPPSSQSIPHSPMMMDPSSNQQQQQQQQQQSHLNYNMPNNQMDNSSSSSSMEQYNKGSIEHLPGSVTPKQNEAQPSTPLQPQSNEIKSHSSSLDGALKSQLGGENSMDSSHSTQSGRVQQEDSNMSSESSNKTCENQQANSLGSFSMESLQQSAIPPDSTPGVTPISAAANTNSMTNNSHSISSMVPQQQQQQGAYPSSQHNSNPPHSTPQNSNSQMGGMMPQQQQKGPPPGGMHYGQPPMPYGGVGGPNQMRMPGQNFQQAGYPHGPPPPHGPQGEMGGPPSSQSQAGPQQQPPYGPGPGGYQQMYGNSAGFHPQGGPSMGGAPPPGYNMNHGPPPPGMHPQIPPAERFHFEIMQLQKQIQHLYTLPPSPQTQMQITDLQERLRGLQQQQQQALSAGPQYPPQQMMPGMYPGGPPPHMMGDGSGFGGESPSKSKAKKKKSEKKSPGKGKKAKMDVDLGLMPPDPFMMGGLDASGQPIQYPPPPPTAEIYDFTEGPPDLPGDKKPKKPRKPRGEPKTPKEKKPKEPKPPKEKSSKSRSKKKKDDPLLDQSNGMSSGENLDGLFPNSEHVHSDLDPSKNGMDAAGIMGEGGSAANTTLSSGEGDISKSQDISMSNTDAESTLTSDMVTPTKPKRPKKPKVKSNSSGRKRPSKTMISALSMMAKKKKRKRSDSEGSEFDKTPPPSPPPEEDNSNKRRSSRNTQRKKYVDDFLIDEDLLLMPVESKKATPKKTPAGTPEKTPAETPTDAASTPLETETSTPIGDVATPGSISICSTPAAPSTPIPVAKTPIMISDENNSNQSSSKPAFAYVNPQDEDTMIVQHILSVRMGKREIIFDTSDEEDEEEEKPKVPEEVKKEVAESSETLDPKKEEEKPIEVDAETKKPDEEAPKESEKSAEVIGAESQEAKEPMDTSEAPKEPETESKMEIDAETKTEPEEIKPESVEEPQKSQDEPKTEPSEKDQPPKESNEAPEKIEKPKKPKRPNETIEIEEFYVKFKNFSYLHCEWRTEEELLKGDKRVNQKIKRFKQKMANNSNMFDFLDEDPFNPEYTEVDRILDMIEVQDPTTMKMGRNYLVKWRSLPYEECTWELEEDVDPVIIAHWHRYRNPPPRDQWAKKKRPKPEDWFKLEESPVYKNGNTLRPYQLEGVNWLSFSWCNARNCILADEMGLGKTIQSLTFIQWAVNYGIRGPFLIIAPLSTIPNWQREFETWTDLNVVVYHGSVASRNMIQEYELFYRHPNNNQMNIKDCYKINVLLTTFEIVMTDVMELKDFNWRICIIDEAHRLKNKNCKLLEGLRMLNLEYRILLSGTPLQNNVNELFSLLNFLEPNQFQSDETFLKEFGELKTDTQCQKLQALLKPMMLRRLKEDVEKSIAPKEETIVEVELTNMQKKYYRAILERNFSFLSKGSTSKNLPQLINTMMELRKCCIHPYLLNGAEEQIQMDYRQVHRLPESDDIYYKALVHSSGKMVLVDKLLPKLKANGHRVLIFSQMVRCLDILEDYLIYMKYPFERIDGRIRGNLRQAAIDRYSKPDSDRFVFLLCTKAGGLGINLTAADTVIIYDSDWNPQNDLQAQARCHRIGQSKMVKVYRLICRNTYEREMFDRASLKLGLDKAVLQSMNTAQGGKGMDTSKQLSKKEIEDLLKKGAYGALMEEENNAADKFCEEDIDQILKRRTQIITLETGEKGSTFSKASFASSGIIDIDIDDPDFWKKWAKRAEMDVDELGEKNELVLDEPRKRTQIKRYGHDEQVMEISELESTSDSDEGDTTNIGERTRGKRRGKKSSRRSRRNDDQDFQYMRDDGIIEYGRWARNECYKVEKGLLTYGWSRWTEILNQGQLRKGWDTHNIEDCARLILCHCVKDFRGDDKVKSFVSDLITPHDQGGAKITRNHSGLANPVSRGGRKKKARKGEGDESPAPEAKFVGGDWTNEDKYNPDLHLDGNYRKHLAKHANKVLLRIRMLYYIKQEIIGDKADKIDKGFPANEIHICPASLIIDSGPTPWWDKEADTSLLIGTYRHGYERYNLMRLDPRLCFLTRCGPPDGKAVLAEIYSNDVNDEELEKDEDESETAPPSEKPPPSADPEKQDDSSSTPKPDLNDSFEGGEKEPETLEKEGTLPPPKEESTEPDTTTPDKEKTPTEKLEGEKPPEEADSSERIYFPSSSDLNTRLRKLITSFQRYFKKEEIRNAQKAKKLERKEKIDQIVRERERQKMEIFQRRWSKKEETDFFRTISTLGVYYNRSEDRYDWAKFKAIARLDKKFDETLTEYCRAFLVMCKKATGRKLTDDEEQMLINVSVETLPEDRAKKTLERIELLNKVREDIIFRPEVDERLRLCVGSLDMPEWWIAGKHDKDLLYGAARHGLGRTDLYYLNDPELSFREILRRHIAGEPLLDPAEKLRVKLEMERRAPKIEEPPKEADISLEVKPSSPSTKKALPDLVNIEIKVPKKEEDAPEGKDQEEASEKMEIDPQKEKIEPEADKEAKTEVEDAEKPKEEPSEVTDLSGKEKEEQSEASDLSEKAKEEVETEEKKEPLSEDVEMKEIETAIKVKEEPQEVEKEVEKIEDKPAEVAPSEEVKEPLEKTLEKEVSEEKQEAEDLTKPEPETETKKLEQDPEKAEEEKVPSKELEESDKPLEKCEDKEIPSEMEVKSELKITIKEIDAKDADQIKESPKFSVPEAPIPSSTSTLAGEEDKIINLTPQTTSILSKSLLNSIPPTEISSSMTVYNSNDANNIEALGSLLNQMNPIRWPRDKAIQIRLEHIVHAIEHNEWPVSKFFSSAGMSDFFDFATPTPGTPDTTSTPVRDTPTPISECSDLAPTEDLIMSLPPSNSSSGSTPGRRGRRRRIAIDVETERAKLQALLNHGGSVHGSNTMSHSLASRLSAGTSQSLGKNLRGLTGSGRGGHSMRRGGGGDYDFEEFEEEQIPLKQLKSSRMQREQNRRDKEAEREREIREFRDREREMKRESRGNKLSQQLPPPAHQHRSPTLSNSLLRSSHHDRRSELLAQAFASVSPSSSSSLDLSKRGGSASAAMSALSSLSSVTVTPVSFGSFGKQDRGSSESMAAPMDLSGGNVGKSRGGKDSQRVSNRELREQQHQQQQRQLQQLLQAQLQQHQQQQKEAERELRESQREKDRETEQQRPPKASKLENMLDKLRKRKLGDDGPEAGPIGGGGGAGEKSSKRKKLDDIVFGLSASKVSTSIPSQSPNTPSGKSSKSPLSSAFTSAGLGLPSPHSSQSAKDQMNQMFNNPLLSATLSFFNSAAGKDFSRLMEKQGGLDPSSGGSGKGKKDGGRGGGSNSAAAQAAKFLADMQKSQMEGMTKSELNRLTEMATPKFDIFPQDAKVNKWLQEHANLTPDRPNSPPESSYLDGNGKRRRGKPRQAESQLQANPLGLDWNKLNGEENVPVINRLSGKKTSGAKAPQLKHLGQWLLENPMYDAYDVDPRWAELVKEKGALGSSGESSSRRSSGEINPKKKGPGRPSILTSPPPSQQIPTSSPSSSSANAFANLANFSSIPGLQGLNPNLLANLPLGSLDPKNPLFMPFGGLGSLGNLGNLSNLGLNNPLFGFGFPGMGGMGGADLSSLVEKLSGGAGASGGGGGGGGKKDREQSKSSANISGESKKDGRGRRSGQSSKQSPSSSTSASSAAQQQAAAQLSSALPFLFPNPGLMYNPLGLGNFSMPGMTSFGLSQGTASLVNGLTGNLSTGKKGSSTSTTTSKLGAGGLPSLNIPNFSAKRSSSEANAEKGRSRDKGSSALKDSLQSPTNLSSSGKHSGPNNPGEASDSDESLMGNHQDDLPDEDEPNEFAERIVIKESKDLEKEIAQQKMETRREKRERGPGGRGGRERGGLTTEERQLLLEKKKERLAKEGEIREPARTTRRSAAAASRNRLEEKADHPEEETAEASAQE